MNRKKQRHLNKRPELFCNLDVVPHHSSRARLGIDIGRVIIAPAEPGTPHDTSFLGGSIKHALATPAVEGAFETIRSLVDLFEGRVWLVSKAGDNVQRKTRAWLHHTRFFDEVGIPQTHLRFCYKRHQKAHHCKELGLTHFIDDRLDVLSHLRNCVPSLYLFGPQRPRDAYASWVEHAESWSDVARYFVLDEPIECSEEASSSSTSSTSK